MYALIVATGIAAATVLASADASAAPIGQPTASTPPAPIGHLQPRARPFSPDSGAEQVEQERMSTFNAEQHKLDMELDRKPEHLPLLTAIPPEGFRTENPNIAREFCSGCQQVVTLTVANAGFGRPRSYIMWVPRLLYFRRPAMGPKHVSAFVLSALLLACAGSAVADQYRAQEFLSLDLSKAVLSPKRLGPPAEFAPVAVEARSDALQMREEPSVDYRARTRTTSVQRLDSDDAQMRAEPKVDRKTVHKPPG